MIIAVVGAFRQRRDESRPSDSQIISNNLERTGQIRTSGRLVNYGVKKSAVSERKERRTFQLNSVFLPPFSKEPVGDARVGKGLRDN